MACDIRKIVTDKIIAGLESGVIPWVKPWTSSSDYARNFDSKKAYRGFNQMLLGFVSMHEGWSDYWLTFKSLAGHGWRLKPEQHGTPVAFFTFIKKEQPDGTETSIPLLRYYTVFNMSQLDGVEIPQRAERPEFVPSEQAESIVKAMPNSPEIFFGGGQAFYSPRTDKVTVPVREDFNSQEGYYSTLFHELGHSTGHDSRLNRIGITNYDSFGSETYSKEELVAEMTAAFLCAEAGMTLQIDNTAAYIKSWLGRLKDDRQLLLSACGQAQKAADYILGKTFTEEEA